VARTYADRYRRPPRKRKPQPSLPVRIVHAKAPKPLKRRRQGVMVSEPVSAKYIAVTPTIVWPVTARLKRWRALRERMGWSRRPR
jgi:hypothetical protein